MNQNEHPFDRRLFFVYVVCSLAFIFYLPSLVPLPPSASDSYIFGYNNRVGIVLLLSLVAIGVSWTRGLNLQFRSPSPSQRVPLRDLVWSLIAVLCTCLAIYCLAGQFGGFGESSYEIDRTWLLSQGKVPYVDFEWPFGVAFLYGPLLLCKLLSISVVHAYYLFWVINCLLGSVLLFAVVNLIDYPAQSKRSIYFLLFGEWFLAILSMGTHYTLVRYVCPLFFILVVHKRLNAGGPHSSIFAAGLAVAFTGTLLLVSPETAIACAFACVCIFLFSRPKQSGRDIVTLGGLLSAFALVFWVALKLHVLDTIKASGGGADSFPIFFAPHILIFFAALFVCGCYVYRRYSEKQLHDNTLGLIAFSIPMIAAALGRCDPGHVALNGLGIFISSMFYLSNYKAIWKFYKVVFIVFLIVVPGIFGIWSYRSEFMRCAFKILSQSDSDSRIGKSINYLSRKYLALSSPEKRAKWEKRLDSLHQGAPPREVDLSAIYPAWHGAILAPFGYKPNGFGSYLSSRVDYGHFEAFENANTANAIREKILEIEQHPEKALVLPDDFEHLCYVDVPAERAEISIVFAFPYFGRAVHTVSARQPVCSYIFEKYKIIQPPSLENSMYGLWVVKSIPRDTSQNE